MKLSASTLLLKMFVRSCNDYKLYYLEQAEIVSAFFFSGWKN